MSKNRIYVMGVRRSGIHLLANWLADQFGAARVENNVDLSGLKQGKYLKLKDADTQIIILEDYPVETIEHLKVDKRLAEKVLGHCDNQHIVVLLRDPFNMAASRIKHYDLLSAKRRWVDKKMALGQWSQYAEIVQDAPRSVVPVLYNEFVFSVEYRKGLCKQLHGVFLDSAMARVDENGLGSSFDGQSFGGHAQDMLVDERWKNYADVDAYWAMFTPEIKDVASTIFGTAVENIKKEGLPC